MQKLVADASTVAGDASADIGTVATFNIQLKVLDLYTDLIQERRSEGIIFALGVALTFMISEFGRYFNQFICYVYGSHLGSLGELTGDEIIRVEQSVMSATFSTTGAVSQIPDLAKASSAQGYILRTIDRASAIDTLISSETEDGVDTAKPSGNCEFVLKSVSFSYPSARDTLSLVAIDLTIRGGESTALVGGSGSGKSTVLRLLQRLYDPTIGSVEMDGVDLRAMDPAWLRRQLAVVGQEPVLYNASIIDNVKYGGPLDPITGEPTATDEQAIEACKRANAADFIEELPQKYNTLVQRSGGSLSGGQKQRIAIARALIREPSVFLLDEATSALDSQSESKVKEALDRETVGQTVVVIAHRLTTTRHCDNIVLLDHGVVAEQCSHREGVSAHEQLIADGAFPMYAKLWRRYAEMNM
jgi:ATP-binding cassette subfamily B (MDR/TAP) protein 1